MFEASREEATSSTIRFARFLRPDAAHRHALPGAEVGFIEHAELMELETRASLPKRCHDRETISPCLSNNFRSNAR